MGAKDKLTKVEHLKKSRDCLPEMDFLFFFFRRYRLLHSDVNGNSKLRGSTSKHSKTIRLVRLAERPLAQKATTWPCSGKSNTYYIDIY
jgi:hypothetical protein